MRLTKDLMVDTRNELGLKEVLMEREKAYLEIQKEGGKIIGFQVMETGNSGFALVLIDYEMDVKFGEEDIKRIKKRS